MVKKRVGLFIFVVLLGQFARIPLAQGREYRLNFMSDKGYIYPVSINGKSYYFWLDTGSTASFIDKSLVRTFKGVIKRQAFPDRLRDTNINTGFSVIKSKDVSLVKGMPIKIGDNIAYPDVLVVSDFSTIKGFGYPISGILGTDILNQFVWEVDNVNKRLMVRSFADQAARGNTSYRQCVYYELNDNAPGVPQINITTAKGKITFKLDTGAPHSLINESLIKQLGLSRATEFAEGVVLTDAANVSYKVRAYSMTNFAFANRSIQRHVFLAKPQGQTSPNYDNFLGVDFLRRFDRFQLNPLYHTLCFDQFNSHYEQSHRFIALTTHNNYIVVSGNNVIQLKRFGLQNGDIIQQINKVNYHAQQLGAAQNVLTQAKTLELIIVRNGKTYRVSIK